MKLSYKICIYLRRYGHYCNFYVAAAAAAAAVVVVVVATGQLSMLGQTPQAALHMSESTFALHAAGHPIQLPIPGAHAAHMATHKATRIRSEKNCMVSYGDMCIECR